MITTTRINEEFMGLKIEDYHLFAILRFINDFFQSGLINDNQSLDLKRIIMSMESQSLNESCVLLVIKNLRSLKRPKEHKNNPAYKNLIDEEIISSIINKFRVHCANLMNSQN